MVTVGEILSSALKTSLVALIISGSVSGYDVLQGGKVVGRIMGKISFRFDDKTKIIVPNANAVNVTGNAQKDSMVVTFSWDNAASFIMTFEESNGNSIFTKAEFRDGSKNAVWSLNQNLMQSNSSYKCSALYAGSKDAKNFATLVMTDLQMQVFNYDAGFSKAVTCPEDLSEMIAGNWNLTSSDNEPCLRLNAAIAFNITYGASQKNYKSAVINVPPSAVVMPESYCFEPGKDVNTTKGQLLVLGFYDEWKLWLHFTRDDNVTHDKKKDHWMVDWVQLDVLYDNDHFPYVLKLNKRDTLKNTVSPDGSGALGLFRTPFDRSFTCSALQAKEVITNFTILTQSLQTQAFMYDATFLTAEVCQADMMVSDVVPIIIGAALAILIVVVLVAYLIGRARTRRQTYENI